VNVWDVRTTGGDPGPSDDLQAMTDALRVFYTDLMAGDIFPGGYTASYGGTATSVGESPEFFTSDTWSITESGPSDVAPPIAQMILTLRTSSATRRGRGRKFIGPVRPTIVQADGTPTTAALGILQTAGNTLLAESEEFADGAIGVYSDVDGLFRDLVSVQARVYFASLRSRRD
jgi:hypothetical protein